MFWALTTTLGNLRNLINILYRMPPRLYTPIGISVGLRGSLIGLQVSLSKPKIHICC